MWMNRYPGKAIFSGPHDPTFGREMTELICAVIVSGLGASLVGQPTDIPFSFQSEEWIKYAAPLFAYGGVLLIWSVLSGILRRRAGWAVSLFLSGLSVPLIPVFVIAVFNAPGLYD